MLPRSRASRPALERDVVHKPGHRRHELLDELQDRDAAEIDALPFSEVERIVKARKVQLGRRGQRAAAPSGDLPLLAAVPVRRLSR